MIAGKPPITAPISLIAADGEVDDADEDEADEDDADEEDEDDELEVDLLRFLPRLCFLER